MMRTMWKAATLVPVVILTASCATSDDKSGAFERTALGKMRESRLRNNAPEAPAPHILPETHFAAARMFEEQGQAIRAIEQYRKAIAVNHHYAEAHNRMGLLLSKISRHEEAIEAFTSAIAIDPRNAHFHNNCGFELMFEQRWEQAEQQLRESIRLQPDLKRAHINLAMVLAKLERFDESLGAFLTVLPEPDAYYNLGLLYRAQQRYGEAARAFEQVLTLNPDFTAAHKQLAALAAHLGPGALGSRAEQMVATTVKADAEPIAHAPPAVPPSLSLSTQDMNKYTTKTDTFSPTNLARPYSSPSSEPSSFAPRSLLPPRNRHSAGTPDPSHDHLSGIVSVIENEIQCVRDLAMKDASILNDLSSYVTSDDPSLNDRVIHSLRMVQEDEWGFTPAQEFMTPHAPSQVLTDSSPSFSTFEDAEELARVNRSSGVRQFLVARPTNRPTKGQLVRETWPDQLQTRHDPAAWKKRLRQMEGRLSSVRFEIDALEKHDAAATDRSAVTSRPAKFPASRVSSNSTPSPNDSSATSTILRDFARLQLQGGAFTHGVPGPGQPSPVRSKLTPPAAPMLVKDPIAPPSDGKPRSHKKPMTDARPMIDLSSPSTGAQAEINAVDSPRGKSQNEWFGPVPPSEFTALDAIVSVVHNDINCADMIKAKVAPSWTVDSAIESWLDDSLAPKPIPASWIHPVPSNACSTNMSETSEALTERSY